MTEQKNNIEELKTIPIFGGFSDNILSELIGVFKKSEYKNGDIIFKEDSSGDTLFIIAKGGVVIEKKLDEEGKEFKQLAILNKGDFFGEMAVIEEKPRTAQARANEDVSLYELSHDKFFDFIKSHPESGTPLLISITRVVLRRLDNTSNELTMLYDLSKLLTKSYDSSKDFLIKAASEIMPYLEGEWNSKVYAYNQFNEEYDLVFAKEVFKEESAAANFKDEIKTGWFNDLTYITSFSSQSKNLGYIIFSTRAALNDFAKNNLATIFSTISSILASSITNIDYQSEERLRQKLNFRRQSL